MNCFVVQVASLGTLWLALSSAAQEPPRSLYDGAAVWFERAQLIKPRENANNLALAYALAPLIIQEVRGTNSPVVPTHVFFQPGAVRLNGQDHAQMTYWWTHDRSDANRDYRLQRQTQHAPLFKGGSARLMKAPSPPRPAKAIQDHAVFVAIQGVRLTLDTNGSPVIYEVLGHTGSLAPIYVTQSVEAAARAEFGSVLPGRRQVVERSLNDAPDSVVPRVIDDPPAVMGPIVYLHAGTHGVATLICRCMAAQARTLVGNAYYLLTPSNLPPALFTRVGRLEDSLRLPVARPTGTNATH